MLNRRQITRYLPRVKHIRQEATLKRRQSEHLRREADRLEGIVDALRGVRLYGGFPMRTINHQEGHEVVSACSDSERSAFVKIDDGQWTVTGYRNDGSETDGFPLGGFSGKPRAMAKARDFVITGG